MRLIDTHCHLYFDSYDGDRSDILTRAGHAGVERILAPGIDTDSSRAAIELAKTYSGVCAAVGVHPNSALTWQPGALVTLTELAHHPAVVAIGEIGLDYYRDRAPQSIQKNVFREQLTLAGQVNLPVIIHTRNAGSEDRACITDLLNILTEMRPDLLDDRPGVVHSFSGNEAEAMQLLEMGFFIGITGPVTFRNAHHLRRVVASVPLERLLIETDGPFLTPHPHRGKRNEPAYVYYVAEKIAEVLDLPLTSVGQATTENAKRLFGF
ncbi:MAG: TatD family hydrolase [Chloroflexota bacterium]|nr:TatD family hydrolase [Chloroflexota bacterium]